MYLLRCEYPPLDIKNIQRERHNFMSFVRYNILITSNNAVHYLPQLNNRSLCFRIPPNDYFSSSWLHMAGGNLTGEGCGPKGLTINHYCKQYTYIQYTEKLCVGTLAVLLSIWMFVFCMILSSVNIRWTLNINLKRASLFISSLAMHWTVLSVIWAALATTVRCYPIYFLWNIR